MRYLRCELHTHTVWSDGSMTPEELAANAAARGYDAIALTDHNTVFAYPRVRAAAEKLGLTVVPGIEWTTFYGHLTVLGGRSPVDWREVAPATVNAEIVRATEAGDAVVLCHPARIGGAICCGCHNDFDIAPGVLSGMEVWSRYRESRDPANAEAERMWLARLDAGEKIAAVYGLDWHRIEKGGRSYAVTYVGADACTPDAIVEGVRRGRTYISAGVELDIRLTAGGRAFELGDGVPEGEVRLTVKATPNADYAREFGVEIGGIEVAGSSFTAAAQGCELDITAHARKGYFFVRVRGRIDGEESELALTSPFYTEGI